MEEPLTIYFALRFRWSHRRSYCLQCRKLLNNFIIYGILHVYMAHSKECVI